VEIWRGHYRRKQSNALDDPAINGVITAPCRADDGGKQRFGSRAGLFAFPVVWCKTPQERSSLDDYSGIDIADHHWILYKIIHLVDGGCHGDSSACVLI